MTIPVRRLAAALLVLSVVAAPGHGVRAADSAGGQGATPAQATEARPWLGVSLVGGPDAASTGVPIRAVAEGGPAAAAGITAGDTLLAINGEAMTSAGQAAERIGALAPGTVVRLRVLHAGEPSDLEVTLGTRPAQD